MRKKIFLSLALFAAVLFVMSESLSYAQPNNPPGPRGGPGAGPKKDRDNNPPGPRGGRGTNWENPPGPQGGPGASPDRKLKKDLDNNPPGPVGGPGTNWENPPGPQGGPGTSPDSLKQKAIVNKPWEKEADTNKDGIVDKTEMEQWKRTHPYKGNNPPGPVGGPGTSPDSLKQKAIVNEPWEKEADTNKDGIVDKTEAAQWKRAHPYKDRDNNPPGPVGGAGTNWENPPGPQGGPGASPDRKLKKDLDNNPPGPKGGRGTNWENPPGPKGGPGASPNRKPGGGRGR